MPYSYKFLEDVALADSAFEVEADSWGELFSGAAAALTAVMVDGGGLAPSTQRHLDLSAGSVEDLLYDWLSEIVYLKDTESLIVASAHADVASAPLWGVLGTLECDRIDPKRHQMGQDVKAVTYHLFSVEQIGNKYKARIVLDI
ncbi:MAG TPA: archease [candidate division Zixibacteria bacterium]